MQTNQLKPFLLILSLSLAILGCSSFTASKDDTSEISAGFMMDNSLVQSPAMSSPIEMNLKSKPDQYDNMTDIANYDPTKIHTGSITIEVNSVEDNIRLIENITEQEQGYIEYLNSYGTDYNQNANLTIRIPQKRFDTIMFKLDTIGIVLNKSIGSEDVSEQLIDLNARLKSYTREEQNLLKLLDKSTTISDIVAIERELSRIRSEIESIEGRLKYYDGKIEMSTININLITAYANNTSPPYGVIDLITPNTYVSLNSIKNFVENDGGRLDYISSDYSNGAQTIELTVIIKRGSFPQIFESIEKLGTIDNKYTNEPQNANKKIDNKIDSRITITLQEPRYLTTNAQISLMVILLLVISSLGTWLNSRRKQI